MFQDRDEPPARELALDDHTAGFWPDLRGPKARLGRHDNNNPPTVLEEGGPRRSPDLLGHQEQAVHGRVVGPPVFSGPPMLAIVARMGDGEIIPAFVGRFPSWDNSDSKRGRNEASTKRSITVVKKHRNVIYVEL